MIIDKKIKKQQGVALITVLLIVSLASIVATEMSARLQLQLQRTTNVVLNQQAYWYAMGAEAFAKQILIESFRDEKNITTKEQIWAQGRNTFPVDYGQISAELIDMQGCFNLNTLITPPVDGGAPPVAGTPVTKQPFQQEALKQLITSLEVDGVSSFEAESMVDALKDWLDSDTMISGNGGAEDDDYSSKEFQYLAGNTFMGSINELRVVEHFTVPVIEKLKDYVCVIPGVGNSRININTLKEAKTLAALLAISEDDASSIISDVPEDGYKSVDEFFSADGMSVIKDSDAKKKMFDVDSEYFKLETNAQFNESFFALTSIMKITNNKDISVISRSVGFF